MLLNIVGLTLILFGVIFLYFFAPYRVRTGGNQLTFITNNVDRTIIKKERRDDIFGKLGLTLVVLGTLLQIAAVLPV